MVNRNLPAPDSTEIFAEASVKKGFFCPDLDANAPA
jgi:hypothetical protein